MSCFQFIIQHVHDSDTHNLLTGIGNSGERRLRDAPRRFYEFWVLASQMTFIERRDNHDHDNENDHEKDKEDEYGDTLDLDVGNDGILSHIFQNLTIATTLFPTAFSKYAITTAIQDVLRYVFLLKAAKLSPSDLPLVVGLCDGIRAATDVLVRFHGGWDARKASLVSTPSGPFLASVLYALGVVLVVILPTIVSWSFVSSCTEPFYRSWVLVFFVVGSYLMSLGHGLLWNVWTQVLKQHAEKRLVLHRESSVSSSQMDIQGKLAQSQVLLRYLASSVAPPFASLLLILFYQSSTASYLIVGLCFVLLCRFVATILATLEGGKNRRDGITETTCTAKSSMTATSTEQRLYVVQWSEMLPAWMSRHHPSPSTAETRPLLHNQPPPQPQPGQPIPGRFSQAFFHCGMFGALTEIVRGGYTRIIALRLATSNTTETLSHSDLTRVLSIAGFVALSSFWLSDLSDSNRRLSAFFSFTVLGVGHLLLASSSSLFGFCASAVAFGLGEGLSTGLRALIKQDYLCENGPLRTLTTPDEGGKRLRRQVCNKIGIWTNVVAVVNGLVVGVLGTFVGMRFASFVFGVVAFYAAYFSVFVLPDTKPRSSEL